jgi:hypothetical protein
MSKSAHCPACCPSAKPGRVPRSCGAANISCPVPQCCPPTAISLPTHNSFPLQLLAGQGPEELYQAVNIVKVPSMIRVEADELTYVMHIVIRWVPSAQNRAE